MKLVRSGSRPPTEVDGFVGGRSDAGTCGSAAPQARIAFQKLSALAGVSASEVELVVTVDKSIGPER